MNAVGRIVSVIALVLSTAVPTSSAQRIHTVANGQTLGGIAKRYGISVTELREANQLPKGVVLKLGQRLLVPSPGEMERLHRQQSGATTTADATESADTAAPADVTPSTTVAADVKDAEPSSPSNNTGTVGTDAAPTESASESSDAGDAGDATTATPPDASTRDDGAANRRAAGPSRPPSTVKPKRTALPAEHRYHSVGPGHTLGKVAKRYRIKIESLCGANGLGRHTTLKVGQKLVIPNGDDDPIVTLGPAPSDAKEDAGSDRRDDRNPNALKQLTVPGAGPVYYYEPSGHGRQSMRPIVVYLHGRGGDAEADCKRWSRIARRFGWLLCPSGSTPHNAGRTWSNNWVSGQHAVMGAVQALRDLYGRRVQLYGNTLVGFSEGAYVAMNVGVRQPRTFNRWLILGADVSYWGGAGLEALKDAKSKVRRVVLITGGRDQVVDDTRTVAGWLENEGVPLRVQTPGDLAHEVAIERRPDLYVSALNWLDNGSPAGKQRSQAKRP